MGKEGRPKSLIYPEARGASSEYYTGRRTLPSELLPSDQYKKARYMDILARIKKVGDPDVERSLMAEDAAKNLDDVSFLEAKRIRENQKALDLPDLPRHSKGKINAADRIIQELGFKKEAVNSASSLPTSKFQYKQSKTGKILKSILPILKPLGIGLSASAIMAAKNPAEAAILEGMGNIIPGGVEELGVSDEQKALDMAYFKRMRQNSERKK